MDPLRTYRNGPLVFDVDDTGGDGDLVVALHGFPQTRTMWAAAVPSISGAGFRVIAPDQRGYSPGARPRRRRDYVLARLADDVVALADAVGADRFHVVGHDWGGAVAWQLGATRADRLHSLTVLSTPHPAAMVRSMLRSNQLLRSWYMLAFQPPFLPERFLSSAFGQRKLRSSLTGSGMSPEMVEESLHLLAGSGASTALNWYRALPFGPPGGPGPVTAPTLYLYGEDDFALGPCAAESTGDHVTGPYRFERLPGVGHWMLDDRPEQVVGSIVEHLVSSTG